MSGWWAIYDLLLGFTIGYLWRWRRDRRIADDMREKLALLHRELWKSRRGR